MLKQCSGTQHPVAIWHMTLCITSAFNLEVHIYGLVTCLFLSFSDKILNLCSFICFACRRTDGCIGSFHNNRCYDWRSEKSAKLIRLFHQYRWEEQCIVISWGLCYYLYHSVRLSPLKYRFSCLLHYGTLKWGVVMIASCWKVIAPT